MNLDQRGIPGISVVTTAFEGAVAAQSKALGFEPAVLYVPHPIQNRTPDELNRMSRLPPPGKNLLSVHPLGGCPMGADVDSGAVNHRGQVFRNGGPAKSAVSLFTRRTRRSPRSSSASASA